MSGDTFQTKSFSTLCDISVELWNDRDAWKARAEKAESEIKAYSMLADNTTVEFAELRDDRSRLKAENEQLRAALVKFGQHSIQCGIYSAIENLSCDCGLAKALAASEGKAKE